MSRVALPTRSTLLFDGESTTVNYVGEASSNVSTSQPSWRIKRITYTGNSIAIHFADGNPEFDNVWDDRAILSYA